MNKRTNNWTNKNEGMNLRMNEQTRMNESMNQQTNKNERTNLWTNVQTRMKELIYDRMNKQEWMKEELKNKEWRNESTV